MPIHDLQVLLTTLRVTQVPGEWCVVGLSSSPSGIAVQASVLEAEGASYVIATNDARSLGIEPEFVGAWLTLDVESALDSAGLTAAVAGALAAVGIACNVFAGLHHDHLLVPKVDSARAIGVLRALKSSSQQFGTPDDPTTRLTTLT